MRLKEILKVSTSVIMSVFILSVSMGLNISKMSCSDDNTLYLGTEVPSCNELEVSCCLEEVIKSCCPETNDNSCERDTENIHFNFETFILSFEPNFTPKVTNILYPYIFSEQNFCTTNILASNNRKSVILTKPILSKIQSFLL